MKKIYVTDATLRKCETNLSFKEKLQVAKGLDKLCVDTIETRQITNSKTDILFIHALAPLLKNSVLSCPVQLDEDSIETTAEILKDVAKKRLHLMIPTSTVQMEYICHKKPKAVLEMIETLSKKCVSLCDDVEFSALDATRSEKEFLYTALKTAINCGVKTITICDTAGEMLPNEFEEFVVDLYKNVDGLDKVNLSVECSNSLNMATACIISAIKSGVNGLKTVITGENYPTLNAVSKVISARGDSIGVSSNVNFTIVDSYIEKLIYSSNSTKMISNITNNGFSNDKSEIQLSKDDDIKTISSMVKQLGYELSEDDLANVYSEFLNVASKKNISLRELDIIIANSALQVAPTFNVKSYLINSGNVITSSAHIIMEKNGEELQEVCLGDGPIDAAFITIEKIIGRHFELDDFQIQSVTEGREAVGSALVKLRSNGKLYSGKGISTDIIGASINAYVNAINKIYFEEI